MVSPERTITEPSACFASLPVSMDSVREPIRISRLCRFTLCIEVASGLLADAEPLDQLCVAFRILALYVIEQASPLADKLQEAAPRVMIFCMDLEMFGQV